MFEFHYKPLLKTRDIIDKKLRAAFHESGHAILGYYHKCPPKEAHIYNKRGEWEGHTINTIAGEPFRSETHVFSAGFYAEAMYTGVYNEKMSQNDKTEWRLSGIFENNLSNDLISKYQEETVLVILEKWHGVEAIARKLYDREDLYQKDMDYILNGITTTKIKYRPSIFTDSWPTFLPPSHLRV